MSVRTATASILGGLPLVLVAVFAVLIIDVSALVAHSGLAAASPAPGATVGGTVDTIELRYGSAVSDVSGSLTSQVNGTDIPLTVLQNSELSITFVLERPLDEVGEYAVRHSVLSDDGDRVDAAYLFSYDPEAPPPRLEILVLDEFDEDGSLRPWQWILIAGSVAVVAVLAWRLARAMARLRAAQLVELESQES